MILLQFCETACAKFLQKYSDVCKLACLMLQSCNLKCLLQNQNIHIMINSHSLYIPHLKTYLIPFVIHFESYISKHTVQSDIFLNNVHAVNLRLNTRLCDVIASIKVENNLRMSVDRQLELYMQTEHRTFFYFRVTIFLMMQNVLPCPITRKFFISKDIQSL